MYLNAFQIIENNDQSFILLAYIALFLQEKRLGSGWEKDFLDSNKYITQIYWWQGLKNIKLYLQV